MENSSGSTSSGWSVGVWQLRMVESTILSIIASVVLPIDCHGLAVCVPGRLKSGDLILDVNNISLVGVTNDR